MPPFPQSSYPLIRIPLPFSNFFMPPSFIVIFCKVNAPPPRPFKKGGGGEGGSNYVTTSGISHPDSMIKDFTLFKTLSEISTDRTPSILKHNFLSNCSSSLFLHSNNTFFHFYIHFLLKVLHMLLQQEYFWLQFFTFFDFNIFKNWIYILIYLYFNLFRNSSFASVFDQFFERISSLRSAIFLVTADITI